MTANVDPVGPGGQFADMRRIFNLQHAAARQPVRRTVAARQDSLARLRALVVDNEGAFAKAIAADFGVRSSTETALLEVVPLVTAIRHARRHLARWMRPERRPVDIVFQPAIAWVRHEPLGVVGVISPWNYPLLLALSPLVDALAAGNRAMIKPSELTPEVSQLLARLVAERFAEDEAAVIGGGVDVAEAFSRLPFDHLVFTGSASVGRKVLAAAADTLTPVTLELGGKSPAVVCPGYPIGAAARSIALGKFANAGQTCIAPDYVLAPADAVRPLAAAIMTWVDKAYPTPEASAGFTSIISDRHLARLTRAVEDARAGGAEVIRPASGFDRGRQFAPTVVIGAPETCALLTEEIFGPVLPIVAYDSLDGAATFAASRDRPLAVYGFSRDRRQREQILDSFASGGATLNGVLLHFALPSLPFGGVGPSGFGAYHGQDGFRRFSHERAVYAAGPVNAFESLAPPWGSNVRSALRFLKRR